MASIKKLLVEFKRDVLTEKEWKATIDVKNIWKKWEDIFEEGEVTDEDYKKFLSEIIAALKRDENRIKNKIGEEGFEEYIELVDDLKMTDDIEEFDAEWARLYDWADFYDVWIGTF